MVRSQRALADLQGLLEKRLRFAVLSLQPQQLGEIRKASGNAGMAGAQPLEPHFQGAAVELLGFNESAFRPAEQSQIAENRRQLGALQTQRLFPKSQSAPQQRLR